MSVSFIDLTCMNIYHILFMHAFSALDFIFKELTLLTIYTMQKCMHKRDVATQL